jgi:group I intron endonuclease
MRGVYEIRNTITGDIYVGASNRIPIRLKAHRRALELNRHHSKRLQADWNKYGPDAFTFQIMRPLSADDLLWEEEALAIFELKPAYNTAPTMKITSREEVERCKEEVRVWREKRASDEQFRIASRRKATARLAIDFDCDCGRAWRIVSENGEQYVERLKEVEE